MTRGYNFTIKWENFWWPLSSHCHAQISKSEADINFKFRTDTPANHIYTSRPFSSQSDHVTEMSHFDLFVTPCQRCDIWNVDLKFTENDYCNCISTLEFRYHIMALLYCFKGQNDTWLQKNHKNLQWLKFGYNFGESPTLGQNSI